MNAAIVARRHRGVSVLVLVAFVASIVGVRVRSDAASSGTALPPRVRHQSAVQRWLPAPLHVVDVSHEAAMANTAPLRAAGFRVVVEPVAAVAGNATPGVWWITNGAAGSIPYEDFSELLRSNRNLVLLDGPSPLSTPLLGLTVPSPSSASRTRSAIMRGIPLTWDTDIGVFVPSVPGRVLASTTAGSPALFRHRNVLWSLPRLDEGEGLRRLPYLTATLRDELALEPAVERRELELYVDPDLEPTESVHDLSARWAANGIRRVHVAAWKDDRNTGARYDYTAFVAAMHRHGIEVYAWLAWPHINSTFWELHQGCRQRNGWDQPARLDWREAVAVEVPECFELAWYDTKLLLESAPFDGVNIVDLSFGRTPATMPFDPSRETPFHPTSRTALARTLGADPASFGRKPDARTRARWDAARRQMTVDLHAKLLGRLSAVPAGRGGLMVSVVSDPELAEPLRALKQRYEFELQLPHRAIAPSVAPDADLLGLHVFDRAGPLGTGRVTRRPRGFELMEEIGAVGASGQRIALHASNSIDRVDLGWARFALASTTTVEDDAGPGSVPGSMIVNGPRPVRLRLVRPARVLEIDKNQTLLSGQRTVTIPAGRHRVVLR